MNNGITIKDGKIRAYARGRELSHSETQKRLFSYNEQAQIMYQSIFKEVFEDVRVRYQATRNYNNTVNPQQN